MTSSEDLVVFKNFSFTYPGQEKHALDSLDIAVKTGEFILVAGQSGCGKSTMAKALCGFLQKGSRTGNVFFSGRDITNATTTHMSGRVGYVQQDPESQIVSFTVKEEVAFGLENFSMPKEDMGERIEWALKAVRGEHLLERETFQLSGGEKQKVAVAAILAMRPEIIILDEPTSSLDPCSTKDILKAISSFHEIDRMTTIVLEHNISSFIPFADRLLIMDEGRVAMDIPASGIEKNRRAAMELKVRLPGFLSPGCACAKTSGKPLLSVSRLSVQREGRRVLQNASLEIFPGEIISLMGDNGSGKTTLLLAILKLVGESSGGIYLNGKSLKGKRTSHIAKHIGLVFQNPIHQIFETSVAGEVKFAPENFSMELSSKELGNILEQFELGDMEERSPMSLSHGQKRRLNIASVQSYKPRLLMLDEPFIGQDLKNSRRIISYMAEHASRGGGVLFISHDPEISAHIADRIIFMENGRPIINAPVEEAFKRLSSIGKHEYSGGYPSRD